MLSAKSIAEGICDSLTDLVARGAGLFWLLCQSVKICQSQTHSRLNGARELNVLVIHRQLT
jgi:hypothetical protein